MLTTFITLTTFNPDSCDHIETNNWDKIAEQIQPDRINWIHFQNLRDADLIQQIGQHFDIHPLIIEDLQNKNHLPKYDDQEHQLFMTLKRLQYLDEYDEIVTEQISFILGENYLLSFQENVDALFTGVRQRITNGKGRARRRSPDYLMYQLIDVVVDDYYPILETLTEKIFQMEDQLMEQSHKNLVSIIHELKTKQVFVRKYLSPLSDVISKLRREQNEWIDESNYIYYSDIYDHLIYLNTVMETNREMLSSLIELNNTNISNSMNNIMKTLTIVTTVFIPLSFVAGLYGMNFDNMPELRWKYGYFFVLGFMVLVLIGMIFYMRRKKWF